MNGKQLRTFVFDEPMDIIYTSLKEGLQIAFYLT